MKKKLTQKKKTIMKAMAVGMSGQYSINFIANFFSITRQTASSWLKRQNFVEKRKIYKSKSANLELREFIKSQGLKGTKEGGSSRRITNKIKYGVESHLQSLPKISHMTTHKILRAELARPLKLRITFGLSEEQIKKRYEFTQFIKRNEIIGKEIIFTDEKIFNLSTHPNLQNTRIRLTHEEHALLLAGNEQVREKLMTVYSKKSKGIMVGVQ